MSYSSRGYYYGFPALNIMNEYECYLAFYRILRILQSGDYDYRDGDDGGEYKLLRMVAHNFGIEESLDAAEISLSVRYERCEQMSLKTRLREIYEAQPFETLSDILIRTRRKAKGTKI